MAGWTADYKDPESFLGIARKASGNNFGGFDSPEFERLMDEAARAGDDPQKRLERLSQAEKLLVDDLGNIPLFFYSYHGLVASHVKGWEDNVMDVHPSKFIRLDR